MTAIATKSASGRASRTPPPTPDYQDELTDDQIAAIRHLTDPDGSRANGRTLLYSPAW